ncbi:DUF4442 domain-containing protein [Nocardia terpenica]|uniref:Tetrameric acyl-CoA thioesterase n=1 Tax=Nocardia terpenica TaxID=455432 RepID=A0A291RMA9_9NOCA|nr:DUF4442 domain-containing protein [Nocardia terpenica]ATL68455.1 tetrameric acyl-CoA thioesterase [Nocardia terpenica]
MWFGSGRFDDRALSSWLLTPRRLRTLLNLAPPLLLLGVRIEAVAEDWTSVDVALRVRRWNSDQRGEAHGWSMFAMCDPFFAMLALGQLGTGYRVRNSSARMEFLAPGRGVVRATMELPRETVAGIRRTIDTGERSVTEHEAVLVDGNGVVVARARQRLYVTAAR